MNDEVMFAYADSEIGAILIVGMTQVAVNQMTSEPGFGFPIDPPIPDEDIRTDCEADLFLRV